MNAIEKTVLISGASSGIGEAISQRLLAHGHRVLGLARDFGKCAIDDEKFTSVSVDLSNINSLSEVCSDILKSHPQISALISNAGSARFGNLEEFSSEQIQRMIELNLTSHICLIRACLPHLKRQSVSHIVLMGSEVALEGGVKGAVYSACKAGLRGVAQSLRKECARQAVHVSIINPGMVNTPFHRQANFQPGTHPQEHLQAEDVAEAVAMVLNAREGCVFDEINLSPLKKVVIRHKNCNQ